MGEAAVKPDATTALIDRLGAVEGLGAWARAARDAAATRFRAMGAPGRRDEYWRYTDPARFNAVPTAPAAVVDPGEAQLFAEIDQVNLVFVDGVLDLAKSDALALDHCEIETLGAAMATDIHWAGDLFGTLEADSQNKVDRPLAALNTAQAVEGMVIRVMGTAPKPVGFTYVHGSETSDAVIHHVVRVEAGASLTLLESGPVAARSNIVLEADIADGGTLHHVRAQGRDHERQAATALFSRLGKESTLKSFTLTVNGVMTRNENVVTFTGDDAVAHVAGACVGDGDFHHDDTVFVTHDGVNCESRQVFKKVLKNGAVGVFQGKIWVKPDAQKTDGYQISQGLLLDEDSQFLAKPELEIYADDVACSHGSTCGSVDEDHLFYLTSRGIPRKTAEAMLVISFLAEAVEEVEDEALKEALLARTESWLGRH